MRLLEYYRSGLRESTVVQDIQRGYQAAVDDLWAALEALEAQLDVSTATWGLAYWEEALGLSVGAEGDWENRRSRVLAKIRTPDVTTVNAIRNVVSSFANGQIAVTEYPAESRIQIEFVGAIGLPPRLDDLQKAVREILPAHLAATYLATRQTWGDVSDKTWGDVAAMTWEELKGEVNS